ncbi:E3 ubiquitin-protein ligase RNF128 isoform X2 [Rana temporaria]|uniref:E3 ubiquitin-protein ligase RNF128 isoform X2 n=1 Tax=Rana temporaria TaxID=8407 RepID=UPI001AAD8511|nr:E3 ubiquitin-protein ligase RNF128 isoform X2 [Rana temporaria]
MTGKTESTLHWLLILRILLKVKGGGTVESNAYVNLSYFNPQQNSTVILYCECGLYGLNSRIAGAQGTVGIPVSPNLQACDLGTKFSTKTKPWIALIERGNCTFSEKILLAASNGAEAVVIYNAPPSTGNQTIPMVHYGTKDTVAIMIGNLKGNEIVNLVRNGFQVTMLIEVGKKHGSWVNHYSIFFVSISFFVVTAATVGYFIFYSARRWRHTRAQNQKMTRLKDEAKKAIGQLQLRTIKQGDKVLGPDGDSCAVCIETYKANDVVRVLTCNHFFHKNCIDPWLLEHRTCPMCKCDILKSLGIAAEEDESDNAMVIASVSNELQRSAVQVDDETRSDNASSGYASVRGADEPVEDPENIYENAELVSNDSSAIATEVLPHADNPTFESENPSHVHNVKS